MTAGDLTFPDDRETNSMIINKLFSGQINKFKLEKRYLKKDKSFFWGAQSAASMRSVNNGEILLISVVIDITDNINSKSIIRQKNDELEKIINERNRFISTLAHDLKTPFNSMIGFSDLLVENFHTYSPDKIEDQIKIINFIVHQTYNLFIDIIAWAKIQNGVSPFSPKNLNFTQICSEVIRSLNLNAEAKQIRIQQLFKEDFYINADPDMLKSILRNLISNSIKFTRVSGSITIKYYLSGMLNEKSPESVQQSLVDNPSFIVIAISDTGIGMDSKKLSNLFGLSAEKSSMGTGNEEGTGMGLLLCKEFAGKHGGKIWAESIPGEGSTFYFSVPKAV
jgi:signal transduction histidine kinase